MLALGVGRRHRRGGRRAALARAQVVKDTGDTCPTGAGRFLQFGEITHKIVERPTRLFAVESCDDRIVPDAARELPRQ